MNIFKKPTIQKSLHRQTPLAVAICSVLSTAYVAPALSAPGEAIGNEFLVNTETFSSQRDSSVAMDADGDFVVSWQSLVQDGDGYGIYAQRYNADGTTAGSEFRVNTVTASGQRDPSVAMDADGDFVVSWASGTVGPAAIIPQDGDGSGIFAQRYNANGVALGAEFQVNTETTNNQFNPNVAMDADGDFVVSWTSRQDADGYGVYAQRYNADGTTAGGEFQVNTETADTQSDSSIAMDADGDFIVSWHSYAQDGNNYGIYAQRYNANGSAAGGEFRVNTETNGFQGSPSVAMDADGDSVVSWYSLDQDGNGVFAQRYNADGVAVGAEFQVNTETTNDQDFPTIGMTADGDFVVAWESRDQDGSGSGVYAQRYSANGSTIGSGFRVNTETVESQFFPSIAMDAVGGFVVSWDSINQEHVGSGFGIYAQRYTNTAGTIDLNLVVNDDTDPVTVGNNFTYSLITTNNGTGTATNVTLSEPIPSGVTYVSDDSASTGWTCGQVATTLECSLPSLNAGATNTIEVLVTASSAGTSTNTVTVSSAQTDTNTTDNTDTETTVINDASGGDTPSSGGGGGLFSWLMSLFLLPLGLKRRH